ncbi:hypothetical protein CRUP_012877 [Coryphaenoides rupestris]|nr:hypothetical protein CRUP_012877 [Coryphaenoides rupestris]
MGTQVNGRRRIPNRDKLTAEDEALDQAEARLAAKRAARAEAREIRMKELERQQKEKYCGLDSKWRHIEKWMVEEKTDFLDKASRTASTLSAATLASLGGPASRRGSCDTSFSVETEASIRDIKEEEMYRRAMVSNAQLHNDKSCLMYQVDTLKEQLADVEEQLWEATRQHGDKAKEVSRLRLAGDGSAREITDLQETLEWKEKKIAALERHVEFSDSVRGQRDRLRGKVLRLRELLKKHGIELSPEVTTNGDAGQEDTDDTDSGSRLDEQVLPVGAESVLELRLRKLLDEREGLRDEVQLLKSQLDQRRGPGAEGLVADGDDVLENGLDPHILDLQRDANRQISDLRFKMVKSEQEVAALEQNMVRLEGQVTRYKMAAESAEKVEDELKVEKRKLQREE